MLTITQVSPDRLAIKSNYYYRDRIKKIPTAQWDNLTKQWSVSLTSLPFLELEFDGELVYKTPKWVLHGEPMPDMSDMYEIHDKTIMTPAMKLKLFDYQDYGVRFMIDKILAHNWVINADDVGLGKSCQSIAVMKWFYENRGVNKMLIVCKKSVKKQWADEIKKFTDMDKDFWIGYTGETARERKKAYEEYARANNGILITNHHTFLNDSQLIKNLNPQMMIVDEVHTVKTRGGKMHDHIMDVARLGMPVIFLTGTPIMSRPSDIYGIACIADNKYFGDWVAFAERYITYGVNPFGGRYSEPMIVGAKHLDELRQKTQDIVIRRTAYEVSIQLPSVNIIKRTVPMDATQKKLLDAIAAKQSEYAQSMEQASSMKVWDDASREQRNTRMAMVEAMMKGLIASKQAVATDPRMFKFSTSKTIQKDFAPYVADSYKMSFKTAAIIEIVEDILASDNKVIIFSKFRTSAMLIADDISAALKVDVLTYTGSENQQTRDQYVDWFRNTNTYNILVGTEAMSDSLNLQVASYVINVDQPDTFATKTQRIGRARRAGSQFSSVTVYDMITEGSKDEERLENIRKNMDLTDALVSIDEAQRIALINAMKNE